ncbi:MAG: sugar nucleotide-binding protein [Ignavibacteria bacterium]|jgi:dTDP-4-dehydrorhamnose reductase
MKILITGGSGIIGSYLNEKLSEENEILTLYNNNEGNCKNFNSRKIDLLNKMELEKIAFEFTPDVIIHAAAISNPAEVEKLDKEYVDDINIGVTEHLAALSNLLKAKIIYTSTDSVYDGNIGQMIGENSPKNPLSYYGETKLLGENKITAIAQNYIILRLALVLEIRENSKNHFSQCYYKLQNGEEVKLFTDMYRTPISALEIVRMINELIKKNVKNEVLNFGCRERLSRYQIVEILCEEANLDKKLLIPARVKDIVNFNSPVDVSMNTEKLNSLGIKQTGFRDSVKKMIEDYESKIN